MIKKKLVLLFVLIILFSFGISTFAGSASLSLSYGVDTELDYQLISSGSRTGRIQVTSLSSSSSPQLHMFMGGTGFVIISRTFTSPGVSTSYYTLKQSQYLKVSAESYSSGTLTANVNWSFNW